MGCEAGVGRNVGDRSDTKVHGPRRIVKGREPAEPGERKEGGSACWGNTYRFSFLKMYLFFLDAGRRNPDVGG